MKSRLLLIAFTTFFIQAAFAAPTVESTDIDAKLIEMATDADITDYCLFGKNEETYVNFVACTQMVGDMSGGLYEINTDPLTFSIPGLDYALVVNADTLKDGFLMYFFVELGVEDPVMKPATKFFDQVKQAIEDHGAARLELKYIGKDFDTSLFGTPIPMFQ